MKIRERQQQRRARRLARHGHVAPIPVKDQAPLTAFQLSENPRICVAITCWNAKPFLERALQSILRQSYPHLEILLLSDGEKTPSWAELSWDDDRVTTVRSPQNRGPYFLQHAALLATDAELFAVQDADDRSDPQRFEILLTALRSQRADASFGSLVEHGSTLHQVSPLRMKAKGFSHELDHFGLWRTASLRHMGGYYAGERVGSDSLVTSLLGSFGRVAVTDRIVYHRYAQPGSLTKSRATGHGTVYRRRVADRLRALYQRALKHGVSDLFTSCIPKEHVKEIEALVARIQESVSATKPTT